MGSRYYSATGVAALSPFPGALMTVSLEYTHSHRMIAPGIGLGDARSQPALDMVGLHESIMGLMWAPQYTDRRTCRRSRKLPAVDH